MDSFVFIQDHWQSIAIIASAFGSLGVYAKQQAYKQFLLVCLDLVRKIAVQELTGLEKRKAVVDAAWTKSPLWVKHFITMEQAEQIAEQAYSLLKGELKDSEK